VPQHDGPFARVSSARAPQASEPGSRPLSPDPPGYLDCGPGADPPARRTFAGTCPGPFYLRAPATRCRGAAKGGLRPGNSRLLLTRDRDPPTPRAGLVRRGVGRAAKRSPRRQEQAAERERLGTPGVRPFALRAALADCRFAWKAEVLDSIGVAARKGRRGLVGIGFVALCNKSSSWP
jgi:hypothetical protein